LFAAGIDDALHRLADLRQGLDLFPHLLQGAGLPPEVLVAAGGRAPGGQQAVHVGDQGLQLLLRHGGIRLQGFSPARRGVTPSSPSARLGRGAGGEGSCPTRASTSFNVSRVGPCVSARWASRSASNAAPAAGPIRPSAHAAVWRTAARPSCKVSARAATAAAAG